MEINFDYVNARALLLPSYDRLIINLVGCGGTGSWLAPHVARVARLLQDQNKQVNVIFTDPDRVEAKNTYRQNFAPAEIGANKARSLAVRYGAAWGLEIQAIQKRLEARSGLPEPEGIRYTGANLYMVIGCVDNAAARAAIAAAVNNKTISSETPRVWWIDCGNSKASGQVVLGCQDLPRGADPWALPDFCSRLPLPTVRHPELLEAQPDELVDTARMSCAEMALIDAQGLSINTAIAAVAQSYLFDMLITKNLRRWGTYIDLASGSMRSKYIVPEPESVSVETERVRIRV